MKSLDNQYQLEDRIDRFLKEKLKKYPEIGQDGSHTQDDRFLRTWRETYS